MKRGQHDESLIIKGGVTCQNCDKRFDCSALSGIRDVLQNSDHVVFTSLGVGAEAALWTALARMCGREHRKFD